MKFFSQLVILTLFLSCGRQAPHFAKKNMENDSDSSVEMIGPALSVPPFTNTQTVLVNFDQSNCSNLSLAITEEKNFRNLSSSDFIYNCSDVDIPLILTSGDGEKTIYLYAQDPSKKILSTAPVTTEVDTIAPVVVSADDFLSNPAPLSIAGGVNKLITWSAADPNLDANPVFIEYSINGGTDWNYIDANQPVSNIGLYSWTVPSIDEGDVKLQITVTDQASNSTSIASISSFAIDSSVPAALAVTIDQGSSTNSPHVTATVSSCSPDQDYILMSNSSTQPSINDPKWIPCTTVSGALNFSPLVSGMNTLYFWVRDQAGNMSSSSDTINLDTLIPVITITSPSTSPAYVGAAEAASYLIQGTCSKSGTIQVTGDITTSIVCISGTPFSYTADFSALPDGDYSANFNLQDSVGNNAAQVVLNLKLVTSTPTVAITSPAVNSYVVSSNQSSFPISGTCSSPGGSVLIYSGDGTLTPPTLVTSTATCDSSGNFSGTINLTSFPETTANNLIVSVDHTDLAGNSSSKPGDSRSFNKDTQGPTLTQTSFSNGSFTTTNTATFGGSCGVVAGDSNITAIGQSVSSPITCTAGSWSTTVTLSPATEGNYDYTFRQIDSYGNASEVNVTWKYDPTPPQMILTELVGGKLSTASPFMEVRVSAENTDANSWIRLARADGSGNCSPSGSWQNYSGSLAGIARTYIFEFPFVEGDQKICAWARDSNGNETTLTGSGTNGTDVDSTYLDITPPEISMFEVGDGAGGTEVDLGDAVQIAWTVLDNKELAQNNHVRLYYTTSASNTQGWTEITPAVPDLGSGQMSHASTYITFTSPSDNFFRVKITVEDEAGNVSSPRIAFLNTGKWELFAGGGGGGGAGGGPLGLRLTAGANVSGQYAAINPNNNDAYVVSYKEGIFKFNKATGKTEVFINHKDVTNTLPTTGTGTISDTSEIDTRNVRLTFDNNGLLYIMGTRDANGSQLGSARIWQIDPATKVVKQYLGGGTSATGTTASSAHVQYGAFTFDEGNSLYFLSHSSPSSNYSLTGSTGIRLRKATQDATSKDVSTVSTVAGNGSRGNPTTGSGVSATSYPFSANAYLTLGGIAAWDNGSKIYYYFYGNSGAFKINGSTTYKSNITGRPYYDHTEKKLYLSDGAVYSATLNTSSSNGDTVSEYVSDIGTGEGALPCLADGVGRSNACSNTWFSPILGPYGKVGFLEGVVLNGEGVYSLRYVDGENKIRTYVGPPSFQGHGLDKQFLKSDIAGIHYKPAGTNNLTAFPEGLYFTDRSAMVVARIGTDGVVTQLAGNQNRSHITAVDGDDFDTNLSLGSPYSTGGVLHGITFGDDGLPILRVGVTENSLVKINASNKLSFLTGTNLLSNYFEEAEAGRDPSRYGLYVYGGKNNLAVKDNAKVFLLGGYVGSENPNTLSAELKLFNFQTSAVAHLMGNRYVTPTRNNDSSNIISATFATGCDGNSECYLHYQPVSKLPPLLDVNGDPVVDTRDRIYFSEGMSLRYVRNPEGTPKSLETLFTTTRTIHNFTFSPDSRRVFYLSDDGKFYCRFVSNDGPADTWCNDTALGPTDGMIKIDRGANQMTWMDANTLLISTYTGLIYKVDLAKL